MSQIQGETSKLNQNIPELVKSWRGTRETFIVEQLLYVEVVYYRIQTRGILVGTNPGPFLQMLCNRPRVAQGDVHTWN